MKHQSRTKRVVTWGFIAVMLSSAVTVWAVTLPFGLLYGAAKKVAPKRKPK
jgi:hypothetical protein